MKKIMSAALAIFLSLAVLVTFTPITGTTYAASKKAKAPKVKVTYQTASSVTLSWGKVKGAKGYKIYKKVGKKYKVAGKTKSKSFTVKGLNEKTAYKFKVRAAKAKKYKKLGKFSKVVKASTTARIDVDAQTIAAAKAIYGESAEAVDLADEVAETLAYDKKYWDSDAGWRTAGSDAEHKAAKYIKQQWESIGLDVELEPVTLDKFQFNSASLTITGEAPKKEKEASELGGPAEDKKDKTEVLLEVTDKQSDIKENGGIISYAVSGTKQRIAKEDLPDDFYDELEIVDMGYGTKADYDAYYDSLEEKDKVSNMNGKIVLVGTDQNYLTWISGPYAEAYNQGAEAVIAYPVDMSEDKSGKTCGNYNEITNNVQDICCDDLGIPCTNVSEKTATEIQEIVGKLYPEDKDADELKKTAGPGEKGTGYKNVSVKLSVDSEVSVGDGTSYMVVGCIKGTGNTGQRILYGGHYDKYFYGFEDNSTSIGTMTGIAQSMIDSNYKPENDIYFIAHGAEEWGQSGTSNDWAMGAWHLISKNHGPGSKDDWTNGTTLALFNIEMDGIYTGQTYNFMLASNENKTINDSILSNEKLLEGMTDEVIYISANKYAALAGKTYSADANGGAFVSTDAISYEDFGIPSYMPWTTKKDEWSPDRYHTQYDNNIPYDEDELEGTYSKDVMKQTIELGAVYGIVNDQTPALCLDFGARCDQLEAVSTGDESYDTAVASLRKAGEKSMAEGNKINADYKAALLQGDYAKAAQLKNDAVAYNNKVLKAFKAVQEGLIATDNLLVTGVKHNIINTDKKYYYYISGLLDEAAVASSVEDYKEAIEAAAAAAYAPNGYYDSYGASYSEETLDLLLPIFTNDEDNWGKNIQLEGTLSDSWKVAYSFMNDTGAWAVYADDEYLDYSKSAVSNFSYKYSDLFAKAKTQVERYVVKETKAINQIAGMLQ